MRYYFGRTVEFALIVAMSAVQWRLFKASILYIKRHLQGILGGLLGGFVTLVGAMALLGLLGNIPHVRTYSLPLNAQWSGWIRGGALLWAVASTPAWVIYRILRRCRQHMAPMHLARRKLLLNAGHAAVVAPFAVFGFAALVERTALRVREIDIPIADLHADLDGLRLVQLSDIHLSAYLSEQEFARVVDAANELRAHILFVTGDLISTFGDPLDACLHQISRLRADAGVLGCLGNHEIYAEAEEYTARQGARLGVPFLRSQTRQFRFGDALMNIAGVDYQKMSRRKEYLVGAERLIMPGELNILLSHNPDVFPVAAQQGWDLTLAGHTHGGQVNVEILDRSFNAARFYTPFVYGLYQSGRSSIYVTRGIGTIGMPVRLGAPPEIAVLRLRKG